MFGESDSESPRVPSPWDSLTPLSSSPPTPGIPKLVPEAEEGNVEYKLQLLSPSPARFARLVTQLKWRLLEGGGQAYYELGVADSGTLVGLPRQQLEQSLETLEMMAGEIGASVIVVKEIEVPAELSSLAESQLERWDGRRSARRKDMLRMKQDNSPTTSATEFETDFSTTDITDAEDTSYSPVTLPAPLAREPEPTRLASPIPLPFDPPFAAFTMDAREDIANYADNEAPDDDVPTHYGTELSFSLEISTVYKPRPMKKRATHIAIPPLVKPAYTRKKLKNGYPASKYTDTICHTGDLGSLQTLPKSKEAGAQTRRDKREVWRELRLDGLLTHAHVPTCRPTELSINSTDYFTISPSTRNHHDPSPVVVVDSPAGEGLVASKEPRLIVEVLLVRKLSLDEAFLDFEGFSLS